jgi:hypothetical protein
MDAFVRVLGQDAPDEVKTRIRDVILEWTGIPVDYRRRSELDRFRAIWTSTLREKWVRDRR